MKRRMVCAMVAMTAARILPAAADPPPLRAICDVAARRKLLGRSTNFIACPAPTPAQQDIQPESYYVDGAYSVVDPAKLKRYQAETAALSTYSAKVAQLADVWLCGRPALSAPATCGLTWLDAWATGGGLLGAVSAPNGEHQRKWILAGLALAYLKLREEPASDAAAKLRVEQWFTQMAQRSLAYYATYRRASYNNHIWWLALALAATAVATNDRVMFDRAVAFYRMALQDIQPDGSLPNEMIRKARALIYHINSLTALVMLAEFGEANGVSLYSEQGGALHRLAERVRDGMADPAWFVAQTGAAQDWGETTSRSWSIGWAEPYYARFPDPTLATLIEHNRPVFYPWLGGSPTHDFGSLQLPMRNG